MIQALVVTSTAVAQPVAALGNFAAVRGLKGIQMQASAGGVFYGGKNAQPLPVPNADVSDVLPVVHLNDLWLRGAGTVTIVCFF